MDYIYFFGAIGSAMMLAAFFLKNLGDLDDNTIYDEVMNLLGSTFLIIYTWDLNAWPLFIMFTIWAVWSAKVLVEKTIKKS
ncbi:hypothetical protein GW756_05380 [bacterium]|nr:hypothetical protein [bacterium]NCQ55341.1 hypothetical protein [Candidatus Parcubacteria bacterium]NCS67146.1 hypothetical protein [Candidatus Peregrinibacteria bacterium]NCS96772.1 hypothetical protein [bacterium]